MKKYVIAYINFYDNEIVMLKGEFTSEMEALCAGLDLQGIPCSIDEFKTPADIKVFAFDCDCMVGAFCLE